MSRSEGSDGGLAEWLGKGRIVVYADAEEIAAMKAEVDRLRGRVNELLEIGTKLTEERRELKKERDELRTRFSCAMSDLEGGATNASSRYEMAREFNAAIGTPMRDRPVAHWGQRPRLLRTTNSESIEAGVYLIVEEVFEMFGAWASVPCEIDNSAFLETAKSIVMDVIRRSNVFNLVSAIDGIVDTAYTLEGLMTRLGVDMDAMFRLVHENNMTKIGGPKDPVTGKQLKPEGYKPPDIVGELDRQARGEVSK